MSSCYSFPANAITFCLVSSVFCSSILADTKPIFGNYPITTSSTIIRTKPMAKPMVLRLEC